MSQHEETLDFLPKKFVPAESHAGPSGSPYVAMDGTCLCAGFVACGVLVLIISSWF